MTAPTLNLPLIKAVLEQVLAHPETHDQEFFGTRRGCDTTQCIAGWAITLSPDAEPVWWNGSGLQDGAWSMTSAVVTGSDAHEDPSEVARRLLGLDDAHANWLFFKANNDEAVAFLRRVIAAAQAPQNTRPSVSPVAEGRAQTAAKTAGAAPTDDGGDAGDQRLSPQDDAGGHTRTTAAGPSTPTAGPGRPTCEHPYTRERVNASVSSEPVRICCVCFAVVGDDENARAVADVLNSAREELLANSTHVGPAGGEVR